MSVPLSWDSQATISKEHCLAWEAPIGQLGAYQQAEETFRRGVATFPHNRAFQVFLAMTLYNLHRYQEAMELLLTTLAETSSDATILQYKRAMLFYAPQLDQVWDAQ
jgi:hypothetical protein